MAANSRKNLAIKFLISAGIVLGNAAAHPTSIEQIPDNIQADIVIKANGNINILKAFDVAFEEAQDGQIKFSTMPEDINLRPVYVSCSDVRTYNAFPWLVSDERLKERILQSYGDDFSKLFGNLKIVDQQKNAQREKRSDIESAVWKIIIAKTRAALVRADKMCYKNPEPDF